MTGNGGGHPEGELLESINSSFGSVAAFKEKFAQTAITRFGSGWGVADPKIAKSVRLRFASDTHQ